MLPYITHSKNSWAKFISQNLYTYIIFYDDIYAKTWAVGIPTNVNPEKQSKSFMYLYSLGVKL